MQTEPSAGTLRQGECCMCKRKIPTEAKICCYCNSPQRQEAAVKCHLCQNDPPVGARICTGCNHYQTWLPLIPLGERPLSLFLPLLSVATAAIAVFGLV